MPAIPMFIQILIGALFAPGILKGFGINFTSGDVQNGIQAGGAAVVAPPATAGAVAEPSKKPTAAQTANDLANNPASMFGLAAVGFVAVFIVAQLRAAGHEMTETSKDLYSAGKSATDSLKNADGSTSNISRRLKK